MRQVGLLPALSSFIFLVRAILDGRRPFVSFVGSYELLMLCLLLKMAFRCVWLLYLSSPIKGHEWMVRFFFIFFSFAKEKVFYL